MPNYTEIIINHIKRDRCIIMLGPELVIPETGLALQKDLVRFLKKETDVTVNQDIDDLFILNNFTSKTFFCAELRKYYQKYVKPESIQNMLARIPCHLYLSISPDSSLSQSFDNQGIPHSFRFYNKTDNQPEIDSPSQGKPLIYNMFGSVAEEDSLIVTHDDLFEFLFSLIGETSQLPLELKHQFNEAKIFIFLGFDFEKWYLKLLLRVFGVHYNTMPIVSGGENPLGEQIKAFYINNFEMHFVDKDIPSLVEELYTAFQEEDLLRPVQEAAQKPLEMVHTVTSHIKEDRIVDALEELEGYFEIYSEDLFKEVMSISGAYNSLSRKINRNTISLEHAAIQQNQIRESILNLVGEVRKHP